eukprot:3915999-Alexandrium_andersonii.AAC.1
MLHDYLPKIDDFGDSAAPAGGPEASRAAGPLALPALVPGHCWSQPSAPRSRTTFSTTRAPPVAKPSAR